MKDWKILCSVREVPEGSMTAFAAEPAAGVREVLGDLTVVVTQVNGRFFVVEDRCGYDDCPLSEGELSDHVITCGEDGTQYDARNGSVIRDRPPVGLLNWIWYGPWPAREVAGPVPAYSARMDGDAVYIKVGPDGRPLRLNPPPAPSGQAPADSGMKDGKSAKQAPSGSAGG